MKSCLIVATALVAILAGVRSADNDTPARADIEGRAPARAAEALDDSLTPLAFFLGEWRGEEQGAFGTGHGERTYRPILKGRYLLAENRSTFPPQGDDEFTEVFEMAPPGADLKVVLRNHWRRQAGP